MRNVSDAVTGFGRSVLLVLALVGGALAAPDTQPATRPAAPTDHRVLVISIDGLRPDLLLRADTPTLHHLLDTGCYTLWAQTTAVSVTIPSHVSMLTGATPQVHQIEWNHDLPLAKPVYPAVPTLFELAHAAGYSTGMVAGKSKFDVLNKPGTLDGVFVPPEEVITDKAVCREAVSMIDTVAPAVMFVHLPENDRVGHAIGWATPQQLATIHGADAAIGEMLDHLKQHGLLDKTLVIVSADHGGAGKTHGPDDVRSRCIPWIAVGPGVRKGVDLTSVAAGRTVRTEDTFATACDFLKVPIDPQLAGKPVTEIYDRRGQELMAGNGPAAAPVAAPAAVAVVTAGDMTGQAPTTRPALAVCPPTTSPSAVVRTRPLNGAGEASLKAAVWVSPVDPAASLLIGTDDQAGLCVYGLDGGLIQTAAADARPSDVSVLCGFPLNSVPVDLVLANARAKTGRGVKL